MEILNTAEQIVRVRKQFERETGEQWENNNINLNYVIKKESS
jgi:hypothetical protein